MPSNAPRGVPSAIVCRPRFLLVSKASFRGHMLPPTDSATCTWWQVVARWRPHFEALRLWKSHREFVCIFPLSTRITSWSVMSFPQIKELRISDFFHLFIHLFSLLEAGSDHVPLDGPGSTMQIKLALNSQIPATLCLGVLKLKVCSVIPANTEGCWGEKKIKSSRLVWAE